MHVRTIDVCIHDVRTRCVYIMCVLIDLLVSDLWLDYIRLEMNDKNGSPEKAGNLHWRALKALADELVQTFVSEYTLMQTGQL